MHLGKQPNTDQVFGWAMAAHMGDPNGVSGSWFRWPAPNLAICASEPVSGNLFLFLSL